MSSNRSTNSFIFQQLRLSQHLRRDPKNAKTKSPEQIETANCTTSSAINNTGIAAVTDKYKRQTNYIVADRFESSTFNFLPDKTWENLFNYTSVKLSSAIDDAYNDTQKKYLKNSGASVCATFLFGNELHIANRGKNLVYLVSVTPGGAARIKLLNKEIIHRPTAPNETERLKIFAESSSQKKDFSLLVPQHFEGPLATKFNGKLGGSLSVSRAFGFPNHQEDGLSNTSEFLHINISAPIGMHQFIISASASLISGVKEAEETIKRLVAKHKNQAPDVIAKVIAEEMQASSISHKSNAVCVMPVIAETEPKYVTYAAVISGHHNNMVAEVIYKNFQMLLTERVEKLRDSQLQSPANIADESLHTTLSLVAPLKI